MTISLLWLSVGGRKDRLREPLLERRIVAELLEQFGVVREEFDGGECVSALAVEMLARLAADGVLSVGVAEAFGGNGGDVTDGVVVIAAVSEGSLCALGTSPQYRTSLFSEPQYGAARKAAAELARQERRRRHRPVQRDVLG
jgi:alkylation response protein AidB-like acyl-CoA dehydrogenase